MRRLAAAIVVLALFMIHIQPQTVNASGPGHDCRWTVGVFKDAKRGWVSDEQPGALGQYCVALSIIQDGLLGIVLGTDHIVIVIRLPEEKKMEAGWIEYHWKDSFAYLHCDSGVKKLHVEIQMTEEI